MNLFFSRPTENYENINGTMLSKIVWVMFLAQHCLPKVAKYCQKKLKVDDRVNYDMSLDDTGLTFV